MTDMSPADFRKYGYQVVDWIAGYLEGIREYPVLPNCEPGDLVDRLPASPPEQGVGMDAILEDFQSLIMPGVTHWNHPSFHAYFANCASGPGILAEMLTAALNVNGMLWKSCPAATELEQVTLSWLRQWLGLPDEFFGIIYDTASMSTLHAIAAAREMADPDGKVRGGAPGLVIYTSEHAHSSVEKGALALGLGQQNVRKIRTDSQFRMDPAALRDAVEEDLYHGRKPFCVVASVGTTSTSSIDPIPPIADIAEAHKMWLHVDGAYGASAAVVPEYQHILEGARRAHSLVINPHKWLFTPMDVSVLYTREPEILRRGFSVVAEFLKTAENPRAVNYMDYGVQLGRRFRALKLWFVFRYFGHAGMCAVIRNHVEWAKRLADIIRTDPDFEVVAPVPLSLICFRHRGSDQVNRKLMDSVNASGKAFLSHTVLNGQFVIRLAIGDVKTTWEDLEQTWHVIARSTPR